MPSKFALLALVAALIAAACSSPPSPQERQALANVEAAALSQLFEEYFEEMLELNPVMATMIGDPRYNDRLPNFLTPEYLARQEAFQRRWLERLKAIDRQLLDGQDRLSYDVFEYQRELAIEGFVFPGHLLPIDQFSNFTAFFAQMGSGQSIQPFQTEKDYRDFLRRMEAVPPIVDQTIANMRQGIELGVVQPAPLMAKLLPQLEAHVVDDVEQSVFWGPIAAMPDDIPGEIRETLGAEYAAAIRDWIVPSYQALHEFVRDEYLPACRESIAISALPDGQDWYAYLVKTQTSTDLTPDEIHQFGLEEVARITEEMRQVMAEVGFAGELADFFEHLRTDERFYFDNQEDLIQGYTDLRDDINARLPAMFDVFPKADYEVREVPSFMAEASAGAFYQPPTPDGSRPGVFYVNTYNLKAQPKFLMETLSIHEASPGHHFQITIAQEVEDLPRFRRFGGTTAYNEGWALYAESIGKELGLFTDPYMYYGRLSDEMLRAMRLVVDTGMHAKGWSRQEAIDYMSEHSSMAETDIIAEVERYIAIPGQALAYKVGQRVISGLRARAEESLGDRFDVKEFHRQILIDGALPMGVLDRKINEWLLSETG